jgi:hypothetical protein
VARVVLARSARLALLALDWPVIDAVAAASILTPGDP